MSKDTGTVALDIGWEGSEAGFRNGRLRLEMADLERGMVLNRTTFAAIQEIPQTVRTRVSRDDYLTVRWTGSKLVISPAEKGQTTTVFDRTRPEESGTLREPREIVRADLECKGDDPPRLEFVLDAMHLRFRWVASPQQDTDAGREDATERARSSTDQDLVTSLLGATLEGTSSIHERNAWTIVTRTGLTFVRSRDREAFSDTHRRVAEVLARVILENRQLRMEIGDFYYESKDPTFDAFRRRVGVRLSKKLNRIRGSQAKPEVLLLLGEPGTEKGMTIRKLVTQLQNDSTTVIPFQAINIAAIPETLIEAQLFGYVRGAFAHGQDIDWDGETVRGRSYRKGVFQHASGGICFIDEIDKLSATAQPRLLRAIEGSVRVIGDADEQSIPLVIVAAANRSLVELVKEKKFDRGLADRFGVPEEAPALRDRGDDWRKFTNGFLKDRLGPAANDLVVKTLATCAHGHVDAWQGNVRMLRNILEWAVDVDERDLTAESIAKVYRSMQTGATEDPMVAIRPIWFDKGWCLPDELLDWAYKRQLDAMTSCGVESLDRMQLLARTIRRARVRDTAPSEESLSKTLGALHDRLKLPKYSKTKSVAKDPTP